MLHKIQGPLGFLPCQGFLAQKIGRLGIFLGPLRCAMQLQFSVGQSGNAHSRHIGVAPRVAQDDRQAQRQQLRAQFVVRQVRLYFSQFSAVAQHQQAQSVQFGQRKSHGICVVQDVGAMLVVVAVRNVAANFMQLRGPFDLAHTALSFFSVAARAGFFNVLKERCRNLANACAVHPVHAKLGSQAQHGLEPQVAGVVRIPTELAQQTVAQAPVG